MMNPLFNAIQINKPKSNVFDLSHEKKLSCNMADLIPVYVQEVVPGDRIRLNTEALIRFAPLVSPVMHRMNVYFHYFFVPNRLVFSGWEDFITGGETGLDATAFPTITVNTALIESFRKNSLADHFGLPIVPTAVSAIDQDLVINALPFRAYQMIYNEYYRDQQLQNAVSFGIGSTMESGDEARLLTMRKRCWEKDYFTSCLPNAQKGGAVNLPMVSSVDFVPTYQNNSTVKLSSNGAAHTAQGIGADAGSLIGEASAEIRIENLENETYDVDNVLTINELRQALKLQEWLEKNARGGSRYIESILVHFGISSSNKSLQRPQYLGGGKQPVVISEVLQSVDSTEGVLGTMGGHGISVGNTNRFQAFFEEHGFVIGIMSILPRTAYQQGVERFWKKTDKFDYYWPEFANLGEQEVTVGELYHDFEAATARAAVLFGYQSRYAEYKYRQSQVSGDFRDTLEFWHLGRIFASEPALNSTFLTADPDTRIFAVEEDTTHLYVQLYHNVKAIRPMPLFGIPSI